MILPPTLDDESLLVLLSMTTQLVCLYGPQIVLLATLSAITIYRREISCNHVYAEEEEEEGNHAASCDDDDDDEHQGKNTSNSSVVKKRIWNDKQAEYLLEGAGSYCSGSSLLPLVESLAQWFSLLLQDETEAMKTDGAKALPSLLSSKQNVSAGDLLELAGNYYCGEPVASLLLNKPFHVPSRAKISRKGKESPQSQVRNEDSGSQSDIMSGLPTDAWIQIMSFLSPRDVISIGLINRSFCNFVNGSNGKRTNQNIESNMLLWKTLWQRDYGWLLQHWNVGRRAVEQSLQHDAASSKPMNFQSNNFIPPDLDKHAYFQFGLAYMDYVLAGHNRVDSCLVGLEGHIYDLSNFLLAHPGSPETVMVHAGQDATQFFHRIGHSRSARRMGQSMCVVVNQGCLQSSTSDNSDYGVRPTARTRLLTDNNNNNNNTLPPPPVAVAPPDESALMAPSKSAVATTGPSAPARLLQRAKEDFEHARCLYQVKAQNILRGRSLVTQPKVYYDPICKKWKAWYMDQNLNNIFLHELD